MKLTRDDIERPGPCLYPECRVTSMLQAGRPGGAAVYCSDHAAFLMANPPQARKLIR